MNVLRTASQWLDRQRSQYLADRVIYHHFGADAVIAEVNAVRGRTLFRAEDDYGVTVRVQSRDFIISAEELTFIPAKGDEIICDGIRFEVLAPNNEPVWRWSGTDEIALRIHTKEIGRVKE